MKRIFISLALALTCCVLLLGAAAGPEVPSAQQLIRRAEQVLADTRYTSSAPAKQAWPKAYESFYSARKLVGPKEKFTLVAASEEPAKLREGFLYPIYALPYQPAGSTELCDVFEAMSVGNYSSAQLLQLSWTMKRIGALTDYEVMPEGATDPFYGEAIFNYYKVDGNLGWHGVANKKVVGDYTNRRSLTMTEGLENQLLAQGFSPTTTTAFAVDLEHLGEGVFLVDGERYGFYCSIEGGFFEFSLRAGVLYTPAELGAAWAEIQNLLDRLPANPATGKPVIYLYPQTPTEVAVKLGYPAESLTYTYPAYNGGWAVTAYPDGRLVNKADGGEHYYLFWEGDKAVDWDFSSGFVVPGGETEAFLREKLPLLGLLPREYNDFITYWVPRMQDAPYNLISFKTEQYEALAPLDITPAPDSVLRVHMSFKPLSKRVEIPPQTLPAPPAREGFTVVEWGGSHN